MEIARYRNQKKNKLSRWRKEMPELNTFVTRKENGLKGLVTFKLRALKGLYDSWIEPHQQLVESAFIGDDFGYTV